MQFFRAVLRLVRLDSSLLGFLSILVPVYARSHSLAVSFSRALPLLFLYMCTFVANDLDDSERDQINHPGRPLPSGRLSLPLAAVLYFVCLALALFSIRQFIDQGTAFWYYALVTLSISYGYVVEYLPSFKTVYVATLITVPLLILTRIYPSERHLFYVASACFLFVFGRELCMDIQDRRGDVTSHMQKVHPKTLALASYIAQTAGLVLIAAQVRRTLGILVLLALGALVALSGIRWFGWKDKRVAIRLMKLELLLGLYFLT